MSSEAIPARYTPEQYLELERKAPYKSEYCSGRIYAMSGASREHNLIVGNIAREISTQLRERPCETYISAMRVKVAATGLYTYPDIVAVCDTPRFDDTRFDTLLNPTIIVEVLSPSTEAYDRRDKFAHYRRLPSLQEYILVAQTRVHVEHYRRQNTQWVFDELSDLEQSLPLPSIGCSVSLSEIYAKVLFPSADSGVPNRFPLP